MPILLVVVAALGLLCAAYLCYYWFNWPMASWRDYRVRRAIREAHSLRLVERFYLDPPTPGSLREFETTITDRAAIKRIAELLTFERSDGVIKSATRYFLIFSNEKGEPLLEVRLKYGAYWTVEGFMVDRGPSVKLWEFLEGGDWRKSAGK